jgi:hypothetical protein
VTRLFMPKKKHAGWSSEFTEPIRLRDGSVISILATAGDLILGLSESRQRAPFWQYAGQLMLAGPKADWPTISNRRASSSPAL